MVFDSTASSSKLSSRGHIGQMQIQAPSAFNLQAVLSSRSVILLEMESLLTFLASTLGVQGLLSGDSPSPLPVPTSSQSLLLSKRCGRVSPKRSPKRPPAAHHHNVPNSCFSKYQLPDIWATLPQRRSHSKISSGLSPDSQLLVIVLISTTITRGVSSEPNRLDEHGR